MADSKVLYNRDITSGAAVLAAECVGYQCGPWRRGSSWMTQADACDGFWHDGYEPELPLKSICS
jgi:hypothetical protein